MSESTDLLPSGAEATMTESKPKSPAPPAHFLRVFGQPSRDTLGEFREDAPSMRQALMMLNGKAPHEASRVGPQEPLYALLTGTSPDPVKAINAVCGCSAPRLLALIS